MLFSYELEVKRMSESPLMIMAVNLTVVFSILILLWGVISVTSMVADRMGEE